LWHFLDGLPRNSHYWAARSQDVELYKAGQRRGLKARKAPPPEPYEYSPELECLAALFYQIQQLTYVVANQNAKKGRRTKPKLVAWPVPRTAADIVRKEEQRAAHEHLESVIRYGDPP